LVTVSFLASTSFLASALVAHHNPDSFAFERVVAKTVAVGVVQDIQSRLDVATGSIISVYDLSVESIEKGLVAGQILRFASYGGEFRGLIQYASGYPQFTMGERVRVFLGDSPTLGLSALGGPGMKSKQVLDFGSSGISPAAGPNAQGYSFSGKRWTISRVGYYINQAGTADIPAGSNDEFTGIKQAAWNWWIDPGAYLEIGFSGTTTLQPTDHYDNYNIVGWVTSLPGSALAQTTCRLNSWPYDNDILECDTEINDDYLWGMNGESNRMDVTSIGVSFFGHWLSLNSLYELDDSTQSMYAYFSYGETSKRTLEWGDAMGIRYPYYYYREAFRTYSHDNAASHVDADYFGGVANRYDLLFVWVPDPSGENYITWMIGYDIDPDTGNLGGTFSPCCPTKPGWVGSLTAGVGVAHAQIDGTSTTDLLLTWVDNPIGENGKYYQIGWNMDSNGNVASWSPTFQVPGYTGDITTGVGVAIGAIDADATPDVYLLWQDETGVPESSRGVLYYQIGWDLSPSGSATWTDPARLPWDEGNTCCAVTGRSVGVRLEDMDMNGKRDIVVLYYGTSSRYRIGWDFSTAGIASVWSREFQVGLNNFNEAHGGGIAIVNIGYSNPNAREIVVGAVRASGWPNPEEDPFKYQWT
jgi:hypothetical protein